jgi:tRNA(Arg) A34 adenosine deaminase TadA
MIKTSYDAQHSSAYLLDLAREPNKMQDCMLKKAAQCAYRSNMTQRHGCVIVDDQGVIVARGFNYKTSHHCHQFSTHAEIDALSKIKKTTDMSNFEMYVVRIGSDAQGAPLKLSHPCTSCTRAIMKTTLRRVYFSLGHTKYTCEEHTREHQQQVP